MKPPRNPRQKGRVPLERALSKLGFASRTEARNLIESGKVKVHGSFETDPARLVNPDTAHIEVLGTKAVKAASRVVLFHKPKGVVTTKRDPEGRRTIYDLLPEELRSFHPVGRLDMHTTGLLLLTNDTRISSFLTDPANAIPRTYVVGVEGEVTQDEEQRMVEGVTDEGEVLKAEAVEVKKRSGKESLLVLTLTEGKNREIRRLCDALGHEVRMLKRIRFGSYELGDLAPGAWSEADPALASDVPAAGLREGKDSQGRKGGSEA
ncbi:MAG: rRNA pseudouridine synthase [Proteobacteria bacterium]|nr:rRNA pseudouridine synthase [Pseudomonadota bacterium]